MSQRARHHYWVLVASQVVRACRPGRVAHGCLIVCWCGGGKWSVLYIYIYICVFKRAWWKRIFVKRYAARGVYLAAQGSRRPQRCGDGKATINKYTARWGFYSASGQVVRVECGIDYDNVFVCVWNGLVSLIGRDSLRQFRIYLM